MCRGNISYMVSLALNDENPYVQYDFSLSQMGNEPPPNYEH